MKFGVVVFPGSNCDDDTVYTLQHNLGQEVVKLWHKDHSLQGCDFVILPGGFSYGDYLRTGAIARFSPIMNEVIEHANRGGYVMGICNGFQILVEAGLLPGVLLRNLSHGEWNRDVVLVERLFDGFDGFTFSQGWARQFQTNPEPHQKINTAIAKLGKVQFNGFIVPDKIKTTDRLNRQILHPLQVIRIGYAAINLHAPFPGF